MGSVPHVSTASLGPVTDGGRSCSAMLREGGSHHAVPTLREVTTMTQHDAVSTTGPQTGNGRSGGAQIMDMKLEVVVLPVADVDRSRACYALRASLIRTVRVWTRPMRRGSRTRAT